MLFKYGYIILYAITVSFGIYHFKKYNHNLYLKLWLYFLIYSFFNEAISRYIIEIYKVRIIVLNNTWFIVNSFFYLIFYLFKINESINKKVVLSLISSFIVCNGIMFFYKDYSNEYFVYSWIIGQLFVVIAIMIYFVELLNSDSILSIQKSLFLWISIGALIFNISLLPIFVIGELIDWQGIFDSIIFSANLLLSLCFITGFIVSKKEYNV